MIGHRLLYIDGDPGRARCVQHHLHRFGHDVEVATEGAAGLARIAEGGIDVVALDLSMPGRDGLDVLHSIRALPDPPPVVFVTGDSESRIAVSALTGAADSIVKDAGGEFVASLEAAVRSSVAALVLRREKAAADRAVIAARDRFEALAAERLMLMREVNHRVGNSLQHVAAFLHLQANASASPETKAALVEANHRVLAIAQVHRRLYASDDVKSVALDDYLAGLIGDLRESADGIGDLLTLQAVPIVTDADSAVSIGVIVTELVINAMKYAYPGRQGPIRVRLDAAGAPRRFRLVVEDDGVGRDGGAPSDASTGLGRTIIDAMAAKLVATVAYEGASGGTRAVLSFSVQDPQDAHRPSGMASSSASGVAP